MKNSAITPTQHAILTHAMDHTQGQITWFPDGVNGGARQKVLTALANRHLISLSHDTWWVSAEGYIALERQQPMVEVDLVEFDPGLDADVANAEAQLLTTEPMQSTPRTRANSKQAQVIAMLQRPEGATIKQMCEATNWLPHTVRGALAGTFKNKLKLNISSTKPPGSERVYQIANAQITDARNGELAQ